MKIKILGAHNLESQNTRQVITVHMNPRQEQEIEKEIAAVTKSLGNQITLGYEGRVVHL